ITLSITINQQQQQQQNPDIIDNNSDPTQTPPPTLTKYYRVIIKVPYQVANEIYTSILASICHLPMPMMRVLESPHNEYQSMSKHLLVLSRDLDNDLHTQLKKDLRRRHFIIMQHVEGRSLSEMNSREILTEKKLLQLGKIMAFDLFVNNFDSFFYYWDNSNSVVPVGDLLANDVPTGDGWHFTIMHTKVNFILNSSFTICYHKHINRLKSLLYSIFANPFVESSLLQKMRDTVNRQHGAGLNDQAGLLIQHGLIGGIQTIVTELTPDILKDTKDRVKSLICREDNHNGHSDSSSICWKRGFDSIYLPFLFDIYDKFEQFSSSPRSKLNCGGGGCTCQSSSHNHKTKGIKK
ncbi:hypothetical protein SAMD00019534_045320, partial [Acytostelium subglobosum LB1]|uniref:hypothetical protein n=1 Tax=Acytostelium subglobosum LB1 TaxID=1410327 RepID=UPI000644894A